MKKGKLIVIEGTDGSGKKTQTQLLIKRLNLEGIPAEHMSFPRYGTPSGRIIGQCYLGKNGLGEGDVAWFEEADKLDPLVASLYYAADRRLATPEIELILESNLFNEFLNSSTIFSSELENKTTSLVCPSAIK